MIIKRLASKMVLVVVLKAGLVALGAGLAAVPAFSSEGAPAVGQFDNFVFALSYQKDFCASHPGRKECEPDTVQGGMGLHGLWPNRDDDPHNRYGYCDLSEVQVGKDWCATYLDVSDRLTGAELKILSQAMPGAKSCLYNHEWYAHGSCSGLSVEDYLLEASSLTFQFWKLTSINSLINKSAGQSLTRESFLQALEQDLGPAVRDAATINCRYDRKAKIAYFSEIRIALDRAKYMDFPAQGSLSRMKPIRKKNGSLVKDVGNCPAEGIMVSE